MDRESLLREKEAKKKAEAEKAAEKERKRAEQAASLVQRDAQRKVKPSEMFLSETDKYSQFDDKVCNFILMG
jgi:cysteinyl-tRNA synthetase